MAAAGVTSSGLKEALSAVQQLPAAVTSALQTVARDTANRIAEKAKTNLQARTHGTGQTAASIHVIEHAERKQFVVDVPGAPGRDPKIPFYLEMGTRDMPARPFLRPAGDSESERYRRDMEKAATATIRKVVT